MTFCVHVDMCANACACVRVKASYAHTTEESEAYRILSCAFVGTECSLCAKKLKNSKQTWKICFCLKRLRALSQGFMMSEKFYTLRHLKPKWTKVGSSWEKFYLCVPFHLQMCYLIRSRKNMFKKTKKKNQITAMTCL